MDKETPPSSKKPNDKKPVFAVNGAVVMLAIVLMLSMTVFLINGAGGMVELTFPELIKIVEAYRPNVAKAKPDAAKPADSVEKNVVEEKQSAQKDVADKASTTKNGEDEAKAIVDAHDLAIKSGPQPLASGTGSVTFMPLADPKVAYVFSDPNDIEIKLQEVSGTVLRRLQNEAPAQAKRLGFRVERLPTDTSEKQLVELLAAKGLNYTYPRGPSYWMSYLPMLLLTLGTMALIYMMMRRMGGAGSPMAFARSRGKMHMQEDLDITFEDVAGIDEAVDEVREVVEFLRKPEKFQALGGRIPKGMLLVGPPGTGKTLLAKAIAGEAGVPFFSLSGSDFVEMFVGVGAARVRDMFQQAEAKSPCIIFIDELDALGKTRGSSGVGGHDEREQTLNALLVEMDGFSTNSGVIILAATNRPETLDPALLRPGRFDRHVLVDRPDVRGREAILKVHAAGIKLDNTVSIEAIASLTPGFVGADLANLCNEAALLAARNGKTSVGREHFDEAIERSAAGLEKKKKVIQPDEKLRVAYHESGHALVAYYLPNTDPVHKVSIIPRGLAALGYTMQRPGEDRYLMTQSELEARIQVLLAGTIVEEMIYDDISTGASNDLQRVAEMARGMVMDYGMSRLGRVSYRESPRSAFLAGGGDSFTNRNFSEQTSREIDMEVKRIIDEAMERVRHILETRRGALEALTKRLMEVEVIDATELRRVMEENSTGPGIVPGTMPEKKRHGTDLANVVPPVLQQDEPKLKLETGE